MALLAGTAAADEVILDDPGWTVEQVRLRMSVLDQHGRGFQSQAGPASGPGSERLWVFTPSAMFSVRQSRQVVHEITIPVDIISAASPDAVDAMSSASRHNESGDLELRSTIQRGDADSFTFQLIGHVEEQLKSRTVGAGWRRSFAEDNAALSVTGTLGYDGFDDVDEHGVFEGAAGRWTYSLNVGFSQLLSPTTVVDAGYGATRQFGDLGNGWSSVPTPAGITDERMPTDRLRQAYSVRLAQRIPQTRSTAKLGYRLYLDNFGVTAHTVEATGYQYLASWLYVRGGYRFHRQNGVSFYTELFAGNPSDPDMLRTADSDLAPLSAHEVSLQLVTLTSRARPWSVSGELLRYWRSNDLQITAVSLAVTRAL
ncbi:MAG: DUF3570 domain-containing protein [Kofleriaceae bacterium]